MSALVSPCKVSEFEKQDQQPRHFDRTRDRTSHSSCKPQAALSQCTTRICSMQRCTSLQPSGGTNLQRSSQCCRTVPGLSSSIHLVAGNQMKLDTRRWDCYEWLLNMQYHVSCNRYGRKLLLWDFCKLHEFVVRRCFSFIHTVQLHLQTVQARLVNWDKHVQSKIWHEQETPVMIPAGSLPACSGHFIGKARPRHSLQNPWRPHWKETSRWRS